MQTMADAKNTRIGHRDIWLGSAILRNWTNCYWERSSPTIISE